MKYQVGDRVRVRDDLREGKIYFMEDGSCSDSATHSMIGLRGKTVTISRCGSKYSILECSFNWTDEMFDDFAEELEPIADFGDALTALLFE